MEDKKRDLVLLLIWPFLASLISFLANANTFASVILFFGLPSLLLSIRLKEHIKKAAIFSLVMLIPAIIFDYLAHVHNVWLVPNSIIDYRLFGFVTLEVMLWFFFLVYFIVMFYEYFLDKHVTVKLWHPRLKYLVVISLALFSIFLVFLVNFPDFRVPYLYLWIGIIFTLAPTLVILYLHSRILAKFLIVQAYFFYSSFIYEISALKLGWWEFPGSEFIGWVSIFGVRFPFEELFFYILMAAIGVLAYYEFFDDDRK